MERGRRGIHRGAQGGRRSARRRERWASSICRTIARCTSRRSTTCSDSAAAPAPTHSRTSSCSASAGRRSGPIALRTALRAPQWNLLDDAARAGNPRLHVLDNVDPANISALLARLDLRRSLFVVTSKSGGTAETMAQYLIIRARLTEALGDDEGEGAARLRHRSGEGRAARHRAQPAGDRARHSLERWRTVQRPDAGGHSSRRARRHRHGRACSTAPPTCARGARRA